MGQRMQFVIKYPSFYLNEGNPNNKEAGFMIVHNNWSYGVGAISRTSELIFLIRKAINEQKNDKIFYDRDIEWSEVLPNIISHLNTSHSLISSDNNDILYDSNYMSVEQKRKFDIYNKNIVELVKNEFDNNNGYIFLNIRKNGKIEYAILNGEEDFPEIKQRSIDEYIKLCEGEESLEHIKLMREYNNLIEIFNECKEVSIEKFHTIEYI